MPDPTTSAFDHSSVTLSKNAPAQIHHDSVRPFLPYKPLIVVWRVLIIVASLVGITISSKTVGFFANLLFFTIQSNVMLALCMGYAVWAMMRKTVGPTPLIKTAVTVYISITALVFNLILSKALASSPVPAGTIIVPVLGGTLSNDLVHVIAPFMAVLDWLLFDGHGHMRWRYALQWLTYPLVYLAFVLIRGLLVSGPYVYPNLHYPYPFLNVDHIGYSGVALNTVIYGVAFWLIGIVFVLVDHTIARLYKRSSTK